MKSIERVMEIVAATVVIWCVAIMFFTKDAPLREISAYEKMSQREQEELTDRQRARLMELNDIFIMTQQNHSK